MAIYSLSHSPIGRSTHAAGTAGAHIHYITREGAQSDHAERLPEGIESDRASVKGWIDREEMADRANARVVDKLMVALPKELDREQRLELVREYCDKLTQERTPYYAAIHAGPKDADNPHAHIVIRDRDLETGKRVIQSSEKGSTERFRAQWEEHANRALERAGREERIDRRSLREQGLDREATRHEGPNVRSMEEKGIPTRIGEENRDVRAYNQVRAEERGAVIDFQKAKAELELERDVEARHQTRMEKGTWDEKGSLAVAEVERVRGGPADRNDIQRALWQSTNNAKELTQELRGLERRQEEIVGALTKAREAQAEIGFLRQQVEKESGWWHKLQDRIGEWNDNRLLKSAVLCRDRDPLMASLRARYDSRNREHANRERLKELEERIRRPLEGKPESVLRQEWETNREKAEGLAGREREAAATRDLYRPAAEGYSRHREASLERDPEIVARHRERLESGVWRPEDSRDISKLEVDTNNPVTREWLKQQAASNPDMKDIYERAERRMDHAEELQEYKQGRAQHPPGVERDRGMDRELKGIERDAMKELDPERFARDVERTLGRTREDLFFGGRGR